MMTDLRVQYASGDCQSVRDALKATIDSDSSSEQLAIATDVADAFVNRSIANLSQLYDALLAVEYQFADPPNAFVLNHSPDEDSIADFEQRMGKVPLLASRWYRRIKSVDFTQAEGQLFDRGSPVAGLGWNVPFIVQSLDKAEAEWRVHCTEREEEDRDLQKSGLSTYGPPTPALITGGFAGNCDWKGFELPSFRFDDVLYNEGDGDQYFGDEIAGAFRYGGFPILMAPERILHLVRPLYGEPNKEYLSLRLPKRLLEV